MQKSVFRDERLRYLANRVTELTTHRANLRELGDIALEVMMSRLKVEESLGHKPHKDERTRLNRTLRQLKDVERNIVRIYVLQSLGQRHRINPFVSYMYKRQTPWESKP